MAIIDPLGDMLTRIRNAQMRRKSRVSTPGSKLRARAVSYTQLDVYKRQAKGGTNLNFGQFGLKAQEPERVTARQIEAARRAITRAMKRVGRVWIRIFPDVPVSKKPTEVRMGKGKGSPEFWAAKVKPGRIMFELDGVSEEIAREALRLGAAKLPIKTRFIQRIAE